MTQEEARDHRSARSSEQVKTDAFQCAYSLAERRAGKSAMKVVSDREMDTNL